MVNVGNQIHKMKNLLLSIWMLTNGINMISGRDIYGPNCNFATSKGKGVNWSPGFPSMHPANTQCKYTFKPKNGFFHARFKIFQLDNKPDRDCKDRNTFTFISTGSLAEKSKKSIHCGYNQTLRVDSFMNGTVEMTFVALKPSFGYQFEWEIISCGGATQIADIKGTFSSPFYPSKYQNNVYCVRHLKTQEGARFKFQITSSDMHYLNMTDCTLDYVKVESVKTENAEVADKFHLNQCAYFSMPLPMYSTTNILRFTFVTDHEIAFTGYYGEYSTDECGGTITDYEGVITSPLYPEFYERSRNCVWTIITKGDNRTILEFDEFIMDTIDKDSENYVSVQSIDDNDILLKDHGTFVGNDPPEPIAALKNRLRITFKSNKNIRTTLFHATFMTLSCGGVLDDLKGSIHSPMFPSLYVTNITCFWTIVGEVDKVVQLSFTSFAMGEMDESCPLDKLIIEELHDGEDAHVIKFCGREIPPTITTDSNHVNIIFKPHTLNTYWGFNLNYEIIPKEDISLMSNINLRNNTCGNTLPLICLHLKCRDCGNLEFHLSDCDSLKLYYNTPFKKYNTLYYCTPGFKKLPPVIKNYGCNVVEQIKNFCNMTQAAVIRIGQITDDCEICYENDCNTELLN